MVTKLLLVVIFVCVIQKLNGRPQETPENPTPMQEAIQKINPELDKITLRLKELKLEIHKTLLKAFTETHGSISKSAGKILEAISLLESNVTEITDFANKSNINIETCLSRQRAKLERFVMVANAKNMKNSEDSKDQIHNFTETANALVKEADDIDKNLNKIIGYCIRQNNLAWQQEKLTECFFNEASYVNKIVDDLYKKKDLIDNYRNTFNKNITTNQENLLKWISSIHGEFLKCVSESEKYLQGSTEQHQSKILDNEDAITTQQDSSDKNTTIEDNPDQDSKPMQGQFGQNHKVLARIQKLEVLLDRLKQLHQYQGPKDSKPQFSLEEEFGANRPINSKKNETFQSQAEANRRFILYISL